MCASSYQLKSDVKQGYMARWTRQTRQANHRACSKSVFDMFANCPATHVFPPNTQQRFLQVFRRRRPLLAVYNVASVDTRAETSLISNVIFRDMQ